MERRNEVKKLLATFFCLLFLFGACNVHREIYTENDFSVLLPAIQIEEDQFPFKKLSAEVEKLLPSELDFNTVIITGACGQIDDFRSGILYYKYFRKGRGLFFWKEYPIEYTVTVNINSLEASVVSLERNEYYTPQPSRLPDDQEFNDSIKLIRQKMKSDFLDKDDCKYTISTFGDIWLVTLWPGANSDFEKVKKFCINTETGIITDPCDYKE